MQNLVEDNALAVGSTEVFHSRKRDKVLTHHSGNNNALVVVDTEPLHMQLVLGGGCDDDEVNR